MTDHLPRWLDGRRFIAWLASEGITISDLQPSQQRTYNRWKAGARAHIYSQSVDTILTDHGLQALIPDHVWSTHQKRSWIANQEGVTA